MTTINMVGFLSGLIFALSLTIALIFYKTWIRNRDRLFRNFAWAFALLSLERILLQFSDPAVEMRPLFYIVRLIAFVTIIVAVWEKNKVTTQLSATKPPEPGTRRHHG